MARSSSQEAASLPLPPKSPRRPTAPTSRVEGLNVSDARMSTATSSTVGSDTLTRGKSIMRDIERGTPGDGCQLREHPAQRTPDQQRLNKQRSLYFEGLFAGPGRSVDGMRERVERESMVVVEVKTNVIIHDEFALLTSLSNQFAARYQRPESCIAIFVAHTGCLMFGASYTPGYIMTVNALPSLLQPVTNKRNAVLLAKVMSDLLGVTPERGCIMFRPVAEECFARDGFTMAGLIEESDRMIADEGRISLSGRSSGEKGLASPSKGPKKKSMRSLRSGKECGDNEEYIQAAPPILENFDAESNQEGGSMGDGKDDDMVAAHLPLPAQKFDKGIKKVSRRKSFIRAVFRKY